MSRVLILLVFLWVAIFGIAFLFYRYRSEGRRLSYQLEREQQEQTDRIMEYVEEQNSIDKELEDEKD